MKTETVSDTQPQTFPDVSVVIDAVRAGLRDAVAEHRLRNVPMVEYRDGKIVVTPANAL